MAAVLRHQAEEAQMINKVMLDDPRACLLVALERVLRGGELTAEELRMKIRSPEILPKPEKEAWEQLAHWAGEADVRARDGNYAAFHFDWLTDLHARLARPPAIHPSAIERRGARLEGV
jgi:hypothetical protein